MDVALPKLSEQIFLPKDGKKDGHPAWNMGFLFYCGKLYYVYDGKCFVFLLSDDGGSSIDHGLPV